MSTSVLISLALFVAVVNGGVLAARAKATVCTTIAEGFFTADTTVYSDPYSLYPNGTLVFNPAALDAIPQVQFQACTPNFLGYSNADNGVNATYAGHLYVPSVDMCLSVQDAAGSPPYEVTTATCGSNDDGEQVLLNWVMINQKIYFGGKTRADGSHYEGHGSCPGSGLFGYQGLSNAIPTVEGVPTPLVCATGEDVFGFIILP